jgi:hypothetical protein
LGVFGEIGLLPRLVENAAGGTDTLTTIEARAGGYYVF